MNQEAMIAPIPAAPYLVRLARPLSYLDFPEKSINWSFLLNRCNASHVFVFLRITMTSNSKAASNAIQCNASHVFVFLRITMTSNSKAASNAIQCNAMQVMFLSFLELQ